MNKYLILLIIFVITGFLVSNLAFAQYKEAETAFSYIWKQVKRWANFVWNNIYSFLSKEVEEEFKKEAQELKEEVTKEAPSIWQRLKDLIY